jgi:ABC-type nitrate/sulfonate/bicarbonate transport system substrate-binding protein
MSRHPSTSGRGRWSAAAVALVVASGLAACGAGSSSDSGGGDGGSGEGGETVRFVAAAGALEWWPVEFGVEQGIFADHGIEIESVNAKSGPEIAAILTSGSADISLSVLDAIVPAISNGSTFDVLDIPGIVPASSIIVTKDVALEHAGEGFPAQLEDLAGLTVGVPALGAPGHRYLNSALAAAGMGEGAVTPIAVGGPGTALAAFQAGQVDALLAYPPIPQLLGADGYSVVLDEATMHEEITGSASAVYWIGAEKFVAERPVVAGRFCDAVEATFEQLADEGNHEAATASLATYLKAEESVASALMVAMRERVGAAEMSQDAWAGAKQYIDAEMPAYDSAVTEVCGAGG